MSYVGTLIKEVKAVNGTFILLWHNESLSDKKPWEGWKGVYEDIIDLGDQQPPRVDEFIAIPAGWDLYFADKATGVPVEGPVHGITVTAEGWFDSDGSSKVQIRVSFQNANDNLYWYGQIAVDGLAFGPK